MLRKIKLVTFLCAPGNENKSLTGDSRLNAPKMLIVKHKQQRMITNIVLIHVMPSLNLK